MPISFNCPNCKKKLSVQDNMAGKVAKCPCGAKLKIPTPRQATPQQATPQQATPQQATPQAQQPLQPLQPLGQTPASTPQQSAFDAASPQGLGTSSPQGLGAAGLSPLGSDPNSAGGLGTGGLMSNAPLGSTAANDPLNAAPMVGGGQLQAPIAGQPVQMAAPDNLQNLNPDFQIQCIQCGQQYQMRPELFGQTVACKCGAPVRFDDPLGAGGAMVNQDPLGLGAMMASDQPVAYQSVSKPSESKKKTKDREDEVLKMYIKDEEEYEKVTKSTGKKSGGGAIAGGMALVGKQGDGELSFAKVISAISALVGIVALGVAMMINPDISGEAEWGDGGLKGMILMLVWCRPTGIVLCSIAGILVILGCIMPKKILLILANDDDDDDDE